MENKARVLRGRVEMIVPTRNGEIRYVSPAIGPDTYVNVGKNILEQGLFVPTGDYTAPLLNAAYNNPEVANEPEFMDVREKMKNNWLWVFNRDIWTPKGVYVVQDTKAEGQSARFDLNELEDILSGGKTERGVRFSKDGKVRFAPKSSYSLGVHTPQTLAQDGFVIANYGIEGAECLGNLAQYFRNRPRTFGLNKTEGEAPEQRVACLGSDWYGGDWLGVVGGDWGGGDRGGCAFGVSK